MNKLGVVHSGYKPIIPIGNRICFRFEIDDWHKGNFWTQTRADLGSWSKYVYLLKRTYSQQLIDSIKQKPEEIFFVLDTLKSNIHDVQSMIKDIVFMTRGLNYRKPIIFSLINEPLERWSQEQIHYNNSIVSREIKKYPGVYFAVGEMACNFISYYKSYLRVKYKYDYISFHSDNNCNVSVLRKFLKLFPKDVKLINNEHYYYNGSQSLGYDDPKIMDIFKNYTDYLIYGDQVKSIYICMPFHAMGEGKYFFLGLNLVGYNPDQVYVTKAWKMLKQYDIKAVIKMYLKEFTNGDKEFQIRALQSALNKAEQASLKVDGWFGGITETVLKAFNEKHNVPNPTLCSYGTWFELIQDLQTEVIIKDLIDLIKVIE